jgi:hypothetical protein
MRAYKELAITQLASMNGPVLGKQLSSSLSHDIIWNTFVANFVSVEAQNEGAPNLYLLSCMTGWCWWQHLAGAGWRNDPINYF